MNGTLINHPEVPSTAAPCGSSCAATGLSWHVHELDESVFLHMSATYWSWRTLFESDRAAQITQHPDYVLTELRFAQTPPRCPACVVAVQRGGKEIAAAVLVPKSIGGEKKFGPAWNLAGYRLAGGRCLGDESNDVREALLSGIRQQLMEARADFLLIEDLDTADPLLTQMETHRAGLTLFRPTAAQTRHRIVFPESFDAWWSGFSSKTRNTLKRKVKAFGEARLERITLPEQVPDFLTHARTISEKSWQTELLGLRIRNDERELHLFHGLASEGTLRSYLLWQGGRPVSFCIGTQFNGLFNYEEVAYDRDVSRSSPGQVLVLKMLEDLFAEDSPRVFDFGGGDAEYKRQFGNAVSESGPVWLLRPGLKSQLIRSYFAGRQVLSRSLRAVLGAAGWWPRLRQWSRRGLLSRGTGATSETTAAVHDASQENR